MKKKQQVLSVLLSAVMIILSCLPAIAADTPENYGTGTYLVTSQNGVNLYPQDTLSATVNINALKNTYLTIISISGNFGYTVYDSVYGWIDLSSGVNFVSSKPNITSSGTVEGVKGIEITKLPDKLKYVEGEEQADTQGLEVSIIFNDANETRMAVTGYSVVFPTLDTYGEKTVNVYYGGFIASFNINVAKVPLLGIVLTMPTKTSYVEGEAISFDGLGVTAYYSDERDGGNGLQIPVSECEITGVSEGDSTLSPGVYNVTVTYKYPEISASFIIYVAQKTVTSLKLFQMPSSPTLYQGQSFNNADFILQATYDNGLTENITDFTIEYNNQTIGTRTARIYYMDKYVAFDYTVLELIETGIEFGDTSVVGCYVGSEVSFANLKVYVQHNSGEKSETKDYELLYDNIDTSVVGSYPITVVYKKFTASFDYTVAKRGDIMIGDVNEDGIITSADARLALRYSANLESLPANAVSAADIDADRKVTASDARKILRVSAELETF